LEKEYNCGRLETDFFSTTEAQRTQSFRGGNRIPKLEDSKIEKLLPV
jgi:hypothetical protein